MERLITKDIERWYDTGRGMCLLIDGARQVGKTYIVREFAKRRRISFVEINLLTDDRARTLFGRARSADDVLTYLGALHGRELVPHETVVFFDEIQECVDLVTYMKAMVEDGRFRYILSGSRLAVETANVRSLPVGYMEMLRMYPMNFAEFLTANGYDDRATGYLEDRFESVAPIEPELHENFMRFFRAYLIVGGMPAAVQRYVDTGDLSAAAEIHESIYDVYVKDMSKYDRKDTPLLKNVFELIPGELNAQNKRFKYASLEPGRRDRSVENAFLRLTDAGVALPVYRVNEPGHPILAGKSRNLLKLFMCDVGLLTHMYRDDGLPVRILCDDRNVNFGGIYENFVAQELVSGGITPYYYKSNTLGELDFLIETGGDIVPIEVKSGKGYDRHAALNNVMDVPNYDLKKAYVFSNDAGIASRGKIVYMPIYMTMFLKRGKPGPLTYRVEPADIPSPGSE